MQKVNVRGLSYQGISKARKTNSQLAGDAPQASQLSNGGGDGRSRSNESYSLAGALEYSKLYLRLNIYCTRIPIND